MLSWPWYGGPTSSQQSVNGTAGESLSQSRAGEAAMTTTTATTINETAMQLLFEQWKTVYRIERDALTDDARWAFGDNLARLIEANKQPTSSSSLEANLLTGMNESSRQKLRGFIPMSEERHLAERARWSQVRTGRGLFAEEPPAAVDWRDYGAVSDVKTQGASCGDCFAFAATGLLEGYFATQYGIMISLSEQEILDCDREHNAGCDGGNYYYAITDYVAKYALSTGAIYPYEFQASGDCRADRRTRVVGAGSQPSSSPSSSAPPLIFIDRDEEALRAAVARGPVAVAVSARSTMFQFYSGGVISDVAGCGSIPDHAVLLIGYGKDAVSGMDYWLLKNSWGPAWGERGYVRLKRNLSPEEMAASGGMGMCGILSQANALVGGYCALSSNASAYPRECLPFESSLFCTAAWGCLPSNASEFLPNGTFRIPDQRFVLISSGDLSFASPAFTASMAVAGVLLAGVMGLLVYLHKLRRDEKQARKANKLEEQAKQEDDDKASPSNAISSAHPAYVNRVALLRAASAFVAAKTPSWPAKETTPTNSLAQFRDALGDLSPLVSDEMVRMFLEDHHGDVRESVAAFVLAGEADDTVFDCVAHASSSSSNSATASTVSSERL